ADHEQRQRVAEGVGLSRAHLLAERPEAPRDLAVMLANDPRRRMVDVDLDGSIGDRAASIGRFVTDTMLEQLEQRLDLRAGIALVRLDRQIPPLPEAARLILEARRHQRVLRLEQAV